MFRQFRSEVATALETALEALDLPTDDLGIERPPDDMDATLASSVAFRLAGTIGEAPPAVAERVADAIDVGAHAYLVGVDTAGPYVNFHAGERYLTDTLAAAAGDAAYGSLPDRDTSVVVEHTSANPTSRPATGSSTTSSGTTGGATRTSKTPTRRPSRRPKPRSQPSSRGSKRATRRPTSGSARSSTPFSGG
jgi:hypothetical protein